MRRLFDPVGPGQVLQHRPHALECGVSRPLLQRRHRVGAAHIDPAHHAGDEVVGGRQFEHELGLGRGVRRLHQHRVCDARGSECRLQLNGHEVAAQGRERGVVAVQPAVVAA